MSDLAMFSFIGVIVTLISIGSPFLSSLIIGARLEKVRLAEIEIRSNEKKQDYERLDAVAKQADAAAIAAANRVAEASKLLLNQQDVIARQAAKDAKLILNQQVLATNQAAESAKLLAESQVRVVEIAQIINNKSDVIHTLVNSQMTSAMQSELDATERELVSLKEIIELKRTTGKDPTKAALAVIDATEIRISELKEKLRERREQDEVAKAQAQSQAQDLANTVQKVEIVQPTKNPVPVIQIEDSK